MPTHKLTLAETLGDSKLLTSVERIILEQMVNKRQKYFKPDDSVFFSDLDKNLNKTEIAVSGVENVLKNLPKSIVGYSEQHDSYYLVYQTPQQWMRVMHLQGAQQFISDVLTYDKNKNTVTLQLYLKAIDNSGDYYGSWTIITELVSREEYETTPNYVKKWSNNQLSVFAHLLFNP